MQGFGSFSVVPVGDRPISFPNDLTMEFGWVKSNYLRRASLLIGLVGTFFVAWPSMGTAGSKPDGAPIDWAKAREWWAFQPPTQAELPKISQAARPSRRVDHFVLAK